jgi:hypothetical protein
MSEVSRLLRLTEARDRLVNECLQPRLWWRILGPEKTRQDKTKLSEELDDNDSDDKRKEKRRQDSRSDVRHGRSVPKCNDDKNELQRGSSTLLDTSHVLTPFSALRARN